MPTRALYAVHKIKADFLVMPRYQASFMGQCIRDNSAERVTSLSLRMRGQPYHLRIVLRRRAIERICDVVNLGFRE